MNTWYVLAKKDNRYKYNFNPIFYRNHVFKSLKKATIEKNKKQKDFNKIVILKRTCELLKN